MHVRDPNGDPNDPGLANDPGLVVVYHRLSRHDQRFGQAPTPFDNRGLAFFGDVVNGQAPTTVHVPDTAFNSVGVGQVPTPARLTQLFAGDPQGQVFGPFAAADGDVEPITTRQAIVVPNRYAVPLLTAGMTPRAAYLAISGMVNQEKKIKSIYLPTGRIKSNQPGPGAY
jgi:hypothetical protein